MFEIIDLLFNDVIVLTFFGFELAIIIAQLLIEGASMGIASIILICISFAVTIGLTLFDALGGDEESNSGGLYNLFYGVINDNFGIDEYKSENLKENEYLYS